MAGYHINKEGKVVKCRAEHGKCPYGNIASITTAEEAKAFNDERQEVLDKAAEVYWRSDGGNGEYTTFEALERAKFVEKATKYALKANDTSNQLTDKTGKYNIDRTKKHKVILNQLMSDVKQKHIPKEKKLLMSAGLPGAGKSTVLEKAKDVLGNVMEKYATVNADDFKEILARENMIPRLKGLGSMECSTFVHGECSYLANLYAAELRKEGYNILYDCTAKDVTKISKKLNDYIRDGYKAEDMQVVYVDVPIDVSLERTKSRYARGLNGPNHDGRYLPEKVIMESKADKESKFTSKNAETVKKLFEGDEFNIKEPIVFNNTTMPPTRIAAKEFFATGTLKEFSSAT